MKNLFKAYETFLEKISKKKSVIFSMLIVSFVAAIFWFNWASKAEAELWWLAAITFVLVFHPFFFSLFFTIKYLAFYFKNK
jgi:hypothetical protein